MDNGVISPIVDFIRELFAGLSSGLLFFGGPADIVRYVVDILLITFVIYYLLLVLRETRAWQLLKGALLIVLITLICGVFGLEMVRFIFDKILYVVAVAFVVIFQPELRRALETVGLKSFSPLSQAFTSDYQDAQHQLSDMIDEMAEACDKMAKTYTGALIIFERNSRLSELTNQENAVKLDSAVSTNMLMSIFYKGSPLHDGAILIRDGRIVAARCHVPLADNYHVREDLGTRHRAAVGASELGDAIAVAISEERGTISVALDGTLYQMQGMEDLRSNLKYLLGVSGEPVSLGQRIRSRYTNRKRRVKSAVAKAKREATISKDMTTSTATVSTSVAVTGTAAADRLNTVISETSLSGKETKQEKECLIDQDKKKCINPKSGIAPISKRKTSTTATYQRVLMFAASFFVSLCLWLYIQITGNPIAEKIVTVRVESVNAEMLSERGLDAYFPVTTVSIEVVGRKSTIDKFDNEDISAYVDFSDVDQSGVTEMEIKTSSGISEYFRVQSQNKEKISVVINKKDSE